MALDRPRPLSRPANGLAALFLLLASAMPFAFASPAFALSEIERQDMPPAPAKKEPADEPAAAPEKEIPLPDPILTTPPATEEPGEAEEEAPAEPETEGDNTARPDADAPVPEIIYNLDRLPVPARRMRELIIEAAKTGELEKLRPLLGVGDGMTQLSFGDVGDDPIAFLKELSGDEEGQEILAILEEVLGAGFVHLDPGTPNELFVWPYFFGVPLDKLDARQRVELFKIVTAGDYEDMKTYGAYIFYRVGISPEGRWMFFVAGD